MAYYNKKLKIAVMDSGYKQIWLEDKIGLARTRLSHIISKSGREATEKEREKISAFFGDDMFKEEDE